MSAYILNKFLKIIPHRTIQIDDVLENTVVVNEDYFTQYDKCIDVNNGFELFIEDVENIDGKFHLKVKTTGPMYVDGENYLRVAKPDYVFEEIKDKLKNSKLLYNGVCFQYDFNEYCEGKNLSILDIYNDCKLPEGLTY